MINATAYMVTRYPNRYEVLAHDQTADQRQERELRVAVLDSALWYLTGEGAGYQRGQGQEARDAAIQELLEEVSEEEGETTYPVIRDKLPDINLDSNSPKILRQWSVQIGSVTNYCEIGLIGYNQDGTPKLIAVAPSPKVSQTIDSLPPQRKLLELLFRS